MMRVWIDVCFQGSVAPRVDGIVNRRPVILPPGGPFHHYNELPQALLGIKPFSDEGWDEDKFHTDHPEIEKAFGAVGVFPEVLRSWTRDSRRVYHLTGDLMTLLEATSIKGWKWKDVPWPFPSFLVTLERPITHSSGGTVYDTIAVINSKVKMGDTKIQTILFLLLGPTLDTMSFFSNEERRQAEEQFNKGKDLRQLNDWFQAKSRERQGKDAKYSQFSFFPEYLEETDLVTDPMIGIHRATAKKAGFQPQMLDSLQHPEWAYAIHYIVGMCLYLKTLPPHSTHAAVTPAPLEVKKHKTRPRAISSTADVCTVHSTITLREPEREAIEKTFDPTNPKSRREVGKAKFIESYFRREAGKGHDPEAPRIKRVTHYLWGKKWLQDGEIPLGAEKIISLQKD